MSDNDSDPKIVKRLNQFPPYTDAQGNIVSTPPEEDINKEIEIPTEDIKEEQIVESKAEEQVEEVDEKEALDNSKNPERTKEYINKLKEQNKELKNYNENVLDSLVTKTPTLEVPQWPAPVITNVIPQNFPGLSQGQINETFKGLVDENGYVDSGLLIEKLNEQKERNEQLQRQLAETKTETQKTNQRLDDFERNEIMRNVHNKFPKLNPSNVDEKLPGEQRFNSGLWEYVRKNMVSEWVNESTSGKPVDPNDKRAEAERLERITQRGMSYLNAGVLNDEGEVDIDLINMKKADKEKITQAETAKKNINAYTGGGSGQRNDYSTHEALVQATLAGKPGALAERLRRAGQ